MIQSVCAKKYGNVCFKMVGPGVWTVEEEVGTAYGVAGCRSYVAVVVRLENCIMFQLRNYLCSIDNNQHTYKNISSIANLFKNRPATWFKRSALHLKRLLFFSLGKGVLMSGCCSRARNLLQVSPSLLVRVSSKRMIESSGADFLKIYLQLPVFV